MQESVGTPKITELAAGQMQMEFPLANPIAQNESVSLFYNFIYYNYT